MPQNTKSSQICLSQIYYFSLSENHVAVDVVRETLCKLLTARYAERCPPDPEPTVSTLIEEGTTTRKRGAKSAKVTIDSCRFISLVELSLIKD